jgi:hypothetical protein
VPESLFCEIELLAISSGRSAGKWILKNSLHSSLDLELFCLPAVRFGTYLTYRSPRADPVLTRTGVMLIYFGRQSVVMQRGQCFLGRLSPLPALLLGPLQKHPLRNLLRHQSRRRRQRSTPLTFFVRFA